MAKSSTDIYAPHKFIEPPVCYRCGFEADECDPALHRPPYKTPYEAYQPHPWAPGLDACQRCGFSQKNRHVHIA